MKQYVVVTTDLTAQAAQRDAEEFIENRCLLLHRGIGESARTCEASTCFRVFCTYNPSNVIAHQAPPIHIAAGLPVAQCETVIVLYSMTTENIYECRTEAWEKEEIYGRRDERVEVRTGSSSVYISIAKRA